LRYTLQKNKGQEAHIRDTVAKAAAMLGQVWREEEIWEGLEEESMIV